MWYMGSCHTSRWPSRYYFFIIDFTHLLDDWMGFTIWSLLNYSLKVELQAQFSDYTIKTVCLANAIESKSQALNEC